MSRPPTVGGVQLPAWTPRIFLRLAHKVLNRTSGSLIIPSISAVREEAGLPPLQQGNWTWESPDRIIGLFPEWFAPRQPDWPSQTRLTGFPMFDQRASAPLDPELERFLDGGEAPIVFTPGSGMWNGTSFFAESVRLCSKVGRRGLFLSVHADHIPSDLPSQIRHVSYAPFSQLLPRCAAIVHHGGIGTSAQAMAAGIPQLVTPFFAHDQFDNAARLRELGVARSIPAHPLLRPVRRFADHLAAPIAPSRHRMSHCRRPFPGPPCHHRNVRLIEESGYRSHSVASR